MKKILLNLFRENRVLFYGRSGGSAESIPSAPQAPKGPKEARLAVRKGPTPSVNVKEGAHSDDVETWCEELRDKCDDLKALAAPIRDNQSDYTHGFVLKSIEIYNQAAKVKDDLSGDSHSTFYTDHTPAQMKEHQHEIDVFEAALVGESGYGGTERKLNQNLLETKASEEKRITDLEAQIGTDVVQLGTVLPPELGGLFSKNYGEYCAKTLLPLRTKAQESLANAMEKGTNVEIEAYIAEAQGNIDEADKLAGIYINNIDDYDKSIRPTLDNPEYTGKIFDIVKGTFTKEAVKTFETGDKTKEESMKPLGEALVTGYEPVFEMAANAEKFMSPALTGPVDAKGATVQASFEDEMKEIFKKTPINPQEAVTSGNTLIDVYKAKAKVASKLDQMANSPDCTGQEGQVVFKAAEAEFATLLGKKNMTKEDAEAEQVKLIAGWDAKMEIVKDIDKKIGEPGHDGEKCKEVLTNFKKEIDLILAGELTDENKAKAQKQIKDFDKNFQMAALIDGNPGKTEDQIKQALAGKKNKDTQDILKNLEKEPLKTIAGRYKTLSEINIAENTDVFEQFSGDGYKGWKEVNKAFAKQLGVSEADYDKDGGESFKQVVRNLQSKLKVDANGNKLAVDGAIGPLTMGAIAKWKAGDPEYAEVQPIIISDSDLVVVDKPKNPNVVAKGQGKKKGQAPAAAPLPTV